jgi:hypothetical protein
MSIGDTPLVAVGNIMSKDILRPSSTQNLGVGFTSDTYRAINITDSTASDIVKMFYVEVFNVTGNANVGSQQLQFPGGLIFSNAYVVLQDMSPLAKLRLYLTYGSNGYVTFQIRSTANVASATTSFLVIGV